MRWLLDNPEASQAVSNIVKEAGGKIVGRTRLQKIFYLLNIAGYFDEFSFEYKHYGPFSEELARATTMAAITGSLEEEEIPTSWGGTYSVFLSKGIVEQPIDASKVELLQVANEANPIDLELSATALFLHASGEPDPWEETKRRKPEKAKRIENAKILLQKLRQIRVPNPFPAF